MSRGETIRGGSDLHAAMHEISQEALRITAALNSGYQDPGEVRRLLGALTGREIDASSTVTKDVPAGAVAVGTPAKQISSVPGYER